MGALSGLKILDFSTLMPGPIATTLLADLGADVISVVGPNKHDLMNDFAPQIDELGISAAAAWLGRNKKSICLNLKNPRAKEVIKSIIQEYDVVLDQFRPGVMKKLGLDYETLRQENPRLIYCSLTGYGQDGPLAMKSGHDLNYMALSGHLMVLDEDYTGAPIVPNFQLADIAGGSYMTVIGLLTAAYYRERTGRGQYVDISMLDSILPLGCVEACGVLASAQYPKGWVEKSTSGLSQGPQYNCYRTADGKYLSVGALEPKFFAGLCQGLGLDDWADGRIIQEDPELFRETLTKTFCQKTCAEWLEVFKTIDTCIEPVLTIREMCSHEQVLARKMIQDVPIPLTPGKSIPQIANPVKLSDTPAEYKHTAYPAGYHTHEILEKFGCSPSEIEEISH